MDLKQANFDFSTTTARQNKTLWCKSLSPVVALQSFWMVVCMTIFLSFGVHQFLIADGNVKSDWKPEKKAYVIDFTTRNTAEQYEMPVLWLTFGFSSNGSQWTEEMMNDTLEHLREIHSTLYDGYITYDSNWTDSDCKAAGVYSKGVMYQKFWGTVGLKCDDPNPSLGDFYMVLSMNMADFSVLRNVDKVSGLTLTVDRELGLKDDGPYLTVDQEHQITYGIKYEEVVVHKLNGSKSYFFDTDLQWQYEPGFGVSSGMVIYVNGDLLVEHWKEYVPYGYIDWFMAMGGLLSVCVTVFLLVGSQMPKIFHGNKSMGILPVFSYTFYNYNKVLEHSTLINNIVK